jgi:localization factor PodJL
VSELSSEADNDSNPSDPESPVRASREDLGGRPAASMEWAAGLGAGIAKRRLPRRAAFEMDRESGAQLVQKLAELEVRLRDRCPDDTDSLRSALAGLEAELRSSRRRPLVNERLGQKNFSQTSGEGAAKPSASAEGEAGSNHASSAVAAAVMDDAKKVVAAVAGKLESAGGDAVGDFGGAGVDRDGEAGVPSADATQRVAREAPIRNLTGGAQTLRELGECVSSLEQFGRPARDVQQSSAQLEAAKAFRAPFEGLGAENLLPETSPAPSKDLARYDAFTRQIETSHGQFLARLETGLAAGAKELNTLKGEPARDPGRGQCAGADLEQEIAKLALRLDYAGQGLASLPSLEGSINVLSAQLEETRRIVSGLSSAVAPKPSSGPGSFADGQTILREIAGLRALYEETAQRAQLGLTAIQESVAKIAGCCARLEAAAVGMRPDRRAGVAHEDPFAPIFTYLAQHEKSLARETLADDSAQGASELQPAAPGDAAGDIGFLIEPGRGFPGRGEHSDPREKPPKASQIRDEEAGRTDFIAAARRAARTAQIELDGATSKSRADGGMAKRSPFLVGRIRGLFIEYKLPLAVGAAVLFVAIGAYALARTHGHKNLNNFVPNFLRQSDGAAEHGKLGSIASPTVASMTPKGQLPPNQVRPAAAEGARLAAAGAASMMASLLNPSRLAAPAETAFRPDAASPFGKLSLDTQAIAGSDAIVAGTIRPAIAGRTPAPPGTPVPTVPAKALPSAALAAAPPMPSGGPLTALAAPPAIGPDTDLLGKAEAGDAAAQFELAVRYAEGGAGPRNFELAAQWYERAAQQGLAVAEYRLGSLYEKGLGVGKDMQRAKDLYQRAAEKGNIRAMHNLGVLAAEGSKPNYTSAALWFGKAAEYGIRDSQYNLAVLLGRGLGLPKDVVKSYTWFAIVAAAGDADAARKRDDVAARLTSSELAAANAAAAGFAPRSADRAANELAPPPAQMEVPPTLGQSVKPKVSGL